ncbi:GGDEF domain-containing protein [Colwellia sp. 12G3]|nr:GGDEF domain-containing protein [Colwellia sp. 12G3]
MLSVAQQSVDLKKFNVVAEEVKELKKTDLVLSLKQLTVYEDLLDALTIEQNLLYFKLVTEIYIEQNKYSTAKKMANKGLSIAKRLASPSILISEILYLKGFAFESLGDISQATKEYKKGLEVAESLHNKVQVASGLINLGAIAYLTDDYKRSLVLLNDAYNIAGQTDDEELKGTVNTELGIIYSHLMQDEQSMAYYQQSYVHFKKAGMLLAAHNSLINIAMAQTYNEDYEQAITVFETIIAESNKDTPSDNMFTVYSGLSWAHLTKLDSNPDMAYQYLLMAKQYLQFTENLDFRLQFYIDEANILYELERFDEVLISIKHIEKILANHQEMPQVKKEVYVGIINLKAAVYYKQGQFQQAYQTKSRVIALTDKLYEKEDNRSIAQVRLRLEAEKADKQSKILYNQKILHEASLHQANLENKEQRAYLIISALVALCFAWVLVKLIQSQHKLKVASNIDTLTGAANRRSLMVKSHKAFKFAKTQQVHLSILMIDIDHFKNINDSFGHSVADKVLAQVASLGVNMMRKSDIFGRYGGEEFMICLPKTTIKSAMAIGERIRLSINEYQWPFNNLEKVTVSIGVATLEDDKDLISLIKRADAQLYQAKITGRNKVCGP